MKPFFRSIEAFSIYVLLSLVSAFAYGHDAVPPKNFTLSHSNETTDPDSTILKKYRAPRVFTANVPLTESDNVGKAMPGATHPTAQKGQGFDVAGVAPNGNLVLKMWVWRLKSELPGNLKSLTDLRAVAAKVHDSTMSNKDKAAIYKSMDIISKRKALNFKEYGNNAVAPVTVREQGDNVRYFTLPIDSVNQVSTEEVSLPNWDITFGILTTPFKIRFRKFAFSNNAGIGTAVYFQKKFNKNWSWGVVPGISLTSVTLDAASTNVHPDGTVSAPLSKSSATMPLTTSSTRPAFTPSLSYVISYKTINFTIGAGCDFISKPTEIATGSNPEAGWIYNGKPWLGIGFGVSLFGNNSSGSATPATDGQAPKP